MEVRAISMIIIVITLLVGGLIIGYGIGYATGYADAVSWGIKISKSFVDIEFNETVLTDILIKYRYAILNQYG